MLVAPSVTPILIGKRKEMRQDHVIVTLAPRLRHQPTQPRFPGPAGSECLYCPHLC